MTTEIGLAKYIEDLRAELVLAMTQGAEADIRFLAKSIDLELQVAAQMTTEGGGKVSFTIFGIGAEGGADRSTGSTSTQTLKLSLDLVDRHGKRPLISAEDKGV